MKLLSVFHGLDGRIGRLVWWPAALVLGTAGYGLYASIDQYLGPSLPSTSEQLAYFQDPDNQLAEAYRASLLLFSVLTALAYPVFCFTSKRLNDRDMPHWVKWAAAAPFVTGPLLSVAGLGWEVGDVGNGVMMARPTMLAQAVGLTAAITAFWLVIECAFRPGTGALNRHGEDPRARNKERASQNGAFRRAQRQPMMVQRTA